jgi:hypothetical protein
VPTSIAVSHKEGEAKEKSQRENALSATGKEKRDKPPVEQ